MRSGAHDWEVNTMKRIKSINGYTIYQAVTERDADNYNCSVGNYNIYLSSDIRDFGLGCSYPEYDDIDSFEAALSYATGSNHAAACELAEEISGSTAQDMELVLAIEARLDAGETAGEIVAAYVTEGAIDEEQACDISELIAQTVSTDAQPDEELDDLPDELKAVLDVELEEDVETDFGGLDHLGETVREFILSSGEHPSTVGELNAMLEECGIMPIEHYELLGWEAAFYLTSDNNPWIGVVVGVDREDLDAAKQAAYSGLSRFFDELGDKGLGFGDCIQNALDEAGISYEVVFPLDCSGDCLSDTWEDFASQYETIVFGDSYLESYEPAPRPEQPSKDRLVELFGHLLSHVIELEYESGDLLEVMRGLSFTDDEIRIFCDGLVDEAELAPVGLDRGGATARSVEYSDGSESVEEPRWSVYYEGEVFPEDSYKRGGVGITREYWDADKAHRLYDYCEKHGIEAWLDDTFYGVTLHDGEWN